MDPSKVVVSTSFTLLTPQATIATDASLVGRGAHLNHHMAQGIWMPQEARIYIKVLELRAVHFVCQAFLPLIWSRHVQLLSNNISALVYINKPGSAKSPSLCSEYIHLWNWCTKHHVMLQVTYLPGTQNSLVDTLSRTLYISFEWELLDATI